MMSTSEAATRELFTQLQPGDRIELRHEVKVGNKRWTSETSGTVVKTERRRQCGFFLQFGSLFCQTIDAQRRMQETGKTGEIT